MKRKLTTQKRVLQLYKKLTPEQKTYLTGIMVGMTQPVKTT